MGELKRLYEFKCKRKPFTTVKGRRVRGFFWNWGASWGWRGGRRARKTLSSVFRYYLAIGAILVTRYSVISKKRIGIPMAKPINSDGGNYLKSLIGQALNNAQKADVEAATRAKKELEEQKIREDTIRKAAYITERIQWLACLGLSAKDFSGKEIPKVHSPWDNTFVYRDTISTNVLGDVILKDVHVLEVYGEFSGRIEDEGGVVYSNGVSREWVQIEVHQFVLAALYNVSNGTKELIDVYVNPLLNPTWFFINFTLAQRPPIIIEDGGKKVYYITGDNVIHHLPPLLHV